jgi:hypothetical protein
LIEISILGGGVKEITTFPIVLLETIDKFCGKLTLELHPIILLYVETEENIYYIIIFLLH